MTKIERLHNFVLTLALVVCAAWYGYFEPSPMRYTNLPFPLVDYVVHAGQPARLVIGRYSVRDEDFTYTISRQLINVDTNEYVSLPPAPPSQIPPGFSITTSAVHVIPFDAPRGHYKLCGIADVPGTIKTNHVHWCSQAFTVVE